MTAEMGNRCHWCNGSDHLQELRPYGPGGALVCHGCVTDPAHPERQAAAMAMFEAEQREAEDARRTALRQRSRLLISMPQFRRPPG